MKKAQGPKLDPNMVIARFEEIANEIDEADERGAGPLAGGVFIVETPQEKYRRLGRPYVRSAGIEEDMKYVLVMSPLMSKTLASSPCIGQTLLGIIIDWNDAEADGLLLAVGEEMANTLLKGCKVHWIRSYQGVADKVCKHQHPEKRAVEKEAFHLVVSAVQKVQTQQEVFCLFECLCGSQDINEVQSIVPGLNLSTC